MPTTCDACCACVFRVVTGRWGLFFSCPSCRHIVDVRAWYRRHNAEESIEGRLLATAEIHNRDCFLLSSNNEAELAVAVALWPESGACAATAPLGGFTIPLSRYPAAMEYFTSREHHGVPWRVAPIPEPTLAYFTAPPSTPHTFPHHRLLPGLLPHQVNGVMYCLERNGRALIADDMGTGKTLQAIAVVDALDAYPCLIAVPASLRITWASELERWLPLRLRSPHDVRIVLSSNDRIGAREPLPAVTIVSFTMLRVLAKEFLRREEWRSIVVDESHVMRTTEDGGAPSQQTAVLSELIRRTPHALLLSGTPSVNRPFDMWTQVDVLARGVLGKDKYEFALSYCEMGAHDSQSMFLGSACTRASELNILLRDSVMLRRTKADVLPHLPEKMRQTVRIAMASHSSRSPSSPQTMYHSVGMGKASAGGEWVMEWLSSSPDDAQLVVFAHHLDVLDALCARLSISHVTHIRIDGSTPISVRPKMLDDLRGGSVRLAVLGVMASGLGIDLSFVAACAFLELPPDNGWMRQAEDRLHRRGQAHRVRVYVLLGMCDATSNAWEGRLVAFEERMWARIGARERDVQSVIDHGGGHNPTDPVHDDYHQPPPLVTSIIGPGPFHFSVSFYTRRVFVYNAESEEPVGWNSTREEALGVAGADAYLEAFDALPPHQQRKLHGVVGAMPTPAVSSHMKSPLSAENKKRPRYIPSGDDTAPLPDGARWVHVTVRYGHAPLNKCVTYCRGMQGEHALCLWCLQDMGKMSDDVSSETSLFCNGACRGEYFVRRSSNAVRSQLFQLEQGVCRACGVDCTALLARLRCAPYTSREDIAMQTMPGLSQCLDVLPIVVHCPTEGALWQADHVLPVREGGGSCGLENLQTLCTPCHREKTKRENARK